MAKKWSKEGQHFRKSANTTKFFKTQFPEYNPYIIPGYRMPGQDNGRPIGGLAQISTKGLKINKTRVNTISPRIQAQVLKLPNSKLLWLNSYLPCDNGTTNIDELNEVLGVVNNYHMFFKGTIFLQGVGGSAQFDNVVIAFSIK